MIRPRRWRLAALGGGVALALGATAGAPSAGRRREPGDVRAARRCPTRPPPSSQGEALYRAHCQSCHGVAGYGDGPAARRPAPAARGPDGQARERPHGGRSLLVDQPRHPGLGHAGLRRPAHARGALGRDQLRARPRRGGASPGPRPDRHRRGRSRSPRTSRSRRASARARALRDWRGRGIVLLVFFTLPGLGRSPGGAEPAHRWRCGFAAARSWACRSATRASSTGLSAAGPCSSRSPWTARRRPGAAYMLFRRDLTAEGLRPEPPPVRHMELLVDRQGYLRARWIPRDLGHATEGWADRARSSPRSTGWRARCRPPRWRPSTCIERRESARRRRAA